MKKIIFSLLFAAILLSPVATLAQTDDQTSAFLISSGMSASSISQIASTVIQILLSFLALIFIALILYAGYLWMTAAGNDEQVSKAKKLITNATIGLAIVIAAYSITYFVFNSLSGAAGGGGSEHPN